MPDQPLVVMPAVGGRSSVDTAIGDGSHRRRRRARGGAMRVASGPAVGGSLGSVHKNVFQLLAELLPAQAQPAIGGMLETPKLES